MTNEAALAAKLSTLPKLSAVLRLDAPTLRTLARAWDAGATEWSDSHPLISLLLGRHHAPMTDVIERGLAVQPLATSSANGIRRRLVTAARADYADVTAAITELFVACRLILVGAFVRFVPPRGIRTPDLEATRGGASATLEAYGLHLSDDARAAADAQVRAFNGWPRGAPVPANIKGAASEFDDGLRVLERSVRPYGAGTHAQCVNRLASKLAQKANGGQLTGRPDGVLVVASWHIFGPSPSDMERARPGEATAILRAAVFGRAGDVIRGDENFEGAPIETGTQVVAGVLAGTSDAKAILWLFHSGSARLFEPFGGGLAEGARALLLEAFAAERVIG